MPDHRLFGYRLPVTDETSARQAVRMSGLPVLMIGASVALQALISLSWPLMAGAAGPVQAVLSLTLTAMLLILIAFRLRAGPAGWMPFVVPLFAASIRLAVVSAYSDWQMAGWIARLQIGLRWVVPLICMIFVIGGARGWRWMRAHGVRPSF